MQVLAFTFSLPFFSRFCLFALLPFSFACENQHMGSPINNDSAKKWHQYGRHVCQKEPAPSAEVRRTMPARFTGFVRAPHDTFPCVASVARASRGRVRVDAELQSKHRAAFGDDDRRGGSRGCWQGGVAKNKTYTSFKNLKVFRRN